MSSEDKKRKPIESYKRSNRVASPRACDESEVRKLEQYTTELEEKLKIAVERIEKSQKLILSLNEYTRGFGSAEVIQDNKVALNTIKGDQDEV